MLPPGNGLVDGCHVYLVLVVGFPQPIIAFDKRPLAEMEEHWLKTWARETNDLANRRAEHEKVHIKNRVIEERIVKQDEFSTGEDFDVEIAKPITPELSDLVRWKGIPDRDGYGAFSCLSTHIQAMGYYDTLDLGGGLFKLVDAREKPRS